MKKMIFDAKTLKRHAREAESQRFDVACVWLYTRILEFEPENDAIWYKLSDSLSGIGLFGQAKEAIKHIKNVPDSVRSPLFLVQALIEEGMGNLAEAELKLRDA